MNDDAQSRLIFIGALWVVVGHAIALLLLMLTYVVLGRLQFFGISLSSIIWYMTLFLGITQFLYVIPECLALRQNGQYNTLKGVMLAALITILLNGGCFLIPSTMMLLRR